MNPLWSQRPVRTAGECPTVIGLHAAAGSPEQWQPLVERLRFRTRVLAPHLRGYAASRASSTGEPLSLDDEAAPIAPLLDAFPGPVYLVGQGYGAAVALKLALARRERISGLVLYEPTLFSLLLADAKSRYATRDIAELRRVLGRDLDAGERVRAALRYLDHWSGTGAWQGLSPRSGRRSPIACRRCARSSTPNSPIRRLLRRTPGSTYRYCSSAGRGRTPAPGASPSSSRARFPARSGVSSRVPSTYTPARTPRRSTARSRTFWHATLGSGTAIRSRQRSMRCRYLRAAAALGGRTPRHAKSRTPCLAPHCELHGTARGTGHGGSCRDPGRASGRAPAHPRTD